MRGNTDVRPTVKHPAKKRCVVLLNLLPFLECNLLPLPIDSLAETKIRPFTDEQVHIRGRPAQVGLHDDSRAWEVPVQRSIHLDRVRGCRGILHIEPDEDIMFGGQCEDFADIGFAELLVQQETEGGEFDGEVGVEFLLNDGVENVVGLFPGGNGLLPGGNVFAKDIERRTNPFRVEKPDGVDGILHRFPGDIPPGKISYQRAGNRRQHCDNQLIQRMHTMARPEILSAFPRAESIVPMQKESCVISEARADRKISRHRQQDKGRMRGKPHILVKKIPITLLKSKAACLSTSGSLGRFPHEGGGFTHIPTPQRWKSRLTIQTAASIPAISAINPTGTAWRVFLMPTEPK